jgi:hypothetical protein
MKALLTTIGIGIATAYSSFAGPSWGFTLGNGAGFSWNGGGVPQPRCNRGADVYIVGPQYYRAPVVYYGQRVRNYSDAPVVMPYYEGHCRPRRSVIIPRSW